MKIALVVHDYHKMGGQGRYVVELVERFAADHEVHVFANRVEERLPNGVSFHRVPAWRARALTTILTFLLPASRRVGSGFDIVHGQGLTVLRQDVITAHICTEAWFSAQANYQNGLRLSQAVFRALVAPLERAVFQPGRSREVIAISERVRRDLRSSYGRAQDVHVIRHGVDLVRFAPDKASNVRAAMRGHLGLPQTAFVSLYVGDLQKGAAIAIDAVASAPGAHLLLVSGSNSEPYRRTLVGHDLSDRVHFLGITKEIERVYAAADVFLFPTFYDAFGMVITEAMASGLAVIASRAAGATELIQSGHDGLLIDSLRDPGPFSLALRTLMDDAPLRIRLGENARRTVERISWDSIARETLRVYERAVATKRRGLTEARPRLTFLVNGSAGSASGLRAQAFAERLGAHYDIRLAFRSKRRGLSILRFLSVLCLSKARLVYVVDTAYSGIVAAAIYKRLAKTRIIVDTGDAIYELAKSVGSRGPFRLWLTKGLEALSIRIADRLVVRGTGHKQYLLARGIQRVTVIQDGVDLNDFQPQDSAELRRSLGLNDCLTVGLVGSVTWTPRHKMAYGWELIEVLRILADLPVKGVLIGAGSGLGRLKSLAKQLGLEDRILFLGWIPHDQLPRYLSVMDVCLSTQSNDLVGQVRTTGKLPLYMAAGRYVLATDVGEARLVLPSEMLIPYEGIKDNAYPARLADRIRALMDDRARLTLGALNRKIARDYFDYSQLVGKLAALFRDALDTAASAPSQR